MTQVFSVPGLCEYNTIFYNGGLFALLAAIDVLLLIDARPYEILQVPCAFSSLPPVNTLNLKFGFIQNSYFMNFVSGIVLKFIFLNFEKKIKSKEEFLTINFFLDFRKDKKDKKNIL
jgi:hypothetical protein